MSVLPLTGLRILDLSRLLPGPYCTMLLADLGAEVVKVETPTLGDYARQSPSAIGGPAMFATINRNKKSVAINYRNPRGREILLRLARDAGAVIETFRPGVVRRYPIDYDAMRQVNPSIIYCSLSGYGQTGPYVQRGGHDLNYLAISGLLGINGTAGGPPVPIGVQVADLAGGMLATIAILAAVLGRQHTGQGAYLDVSMLDAAISWAAPMAGTYFLSTGSNPQRGQMALSGGLACYNVYETSDGKFITLGALEPNFWTVFCDAVNRSELVSRQYDPDLIPEIAALFRQRTREEWLTIFGRVDACVEPVNDIDEMLLDPQVRHRGLVTQAQHSTAQQFGSPFQFASRSASSPAPALGEHTGQVLAQAGLSDDEIAELETAGVIKTTRK